MGGKNLVERILAGERGQFSTLVENHAGLVWATCSAYIDNPADREDVVQEIFTTCYMRLDTLREPDAIGPWLHTLARRRCLDWLRARKRRNAALERYQTEPASAEPDAAPPADREIQREELHEFIRSMMGALPPKTREAMLLHYAEGYSVAEGARLLGISRDSFKKRLQYGRQSISDQVRDELAPALREERHSQDMVRGISAGIPLSTAPWLSGGVEASVTGVVGSGLGAGTVKVGMAIVGLLVIVGLVVVSNFVPRTEEPAGREARSAQQAIEAPIVAPSDGGEAADMEGPAPTPAESAAPARRGPGVVRGTVLDEGGQTVSGAKVSLVSNPWFVSTARQDHWLLETTTDESGAFTLSGFELGRYALFARTEKEVGRKLFSLNGKQATIEVVLRPGEWVSGQVVDDGGQPVSGARVGVAAFLANGRYIHETIGLDLSGSTHSERLEVGGVYEAFSDESGHFAVGPLPAESVELHTRHPEFAPDYGPALPAGATDIRIALGQGGQFAGRAVRLVDGMPLPDVPIVLEGATYVDAYTARSGADGRVDLERIRPGAYRVRTSEGDAQVVAVDSGLFVEVAGDPNNDLHEIPVAAGGIVRGNVLVGVGRSPLSGATLELVRRRHYGLGDSRTQSDRTGGFEFTGLEFGVYEIKLWADPEREDYDETRRRLVQVGPGTVVEGLDFLTPPRVDILGRVESPSGEGVANAYVHSRRPGGAVLQATTYADGTFTLAGALAGEELRIGATSGVLVAESEKSIEAGEEGAVVLTLMAGGRIEGTVKRHDGSPARKSYVFLSGDAVEFGERVNYGQDGRFALEGLRPGAHRLTVGRDGPHYDVTVQAGRTAPPVHIVVDEGEPDPERNGVRKAPVSRTGILSGRVADSQGNPVTGAVVDISQGGSRSARTGLDGRYRFQGLLDAECRVFGVHRAGYLQLARTATKKFDVGTTNADFTLDRMGTVSGRVIDKETGEPITNFDVATKLRADEKALTQYGHYMKWTAGGGPEGTFTAYFERDEAHPVNLAARAPGYVTSTFDVGVVGPNTETKDVVVALEPGGRVDGDVRSSRSEPVIGAEIYPGSIDTLDYMDRIQPLAVSDENGHYEIDSMPVGESFVTVRHSDYAILRTEILVGREPVTEHHIILAAGARIRGTITQGGGPVERAQIGFTVPDEFETRYVSTDEAGQFEAVGLPPGEMGLRVKGHQEDLVLVDGDDIILDIRLPETTGRIAGTILMNGEAISDTSASCRVTIDTEFGPYESFAGAMAGRYLIKDVPAGSGELTVNARIGGERVKNSVPVEIGPDEELQLDIDLASAPDDQPVE